MKYCEYFPWPLEKITRKNLLQDRLKGTYSSHSIFFITYESDQKARELQYTDLERLCLCKHLSLFGLFVSYEENEVLSIHPLGSYSQHFI